MRISTYPFTIASALHRVFILSNEQSGVLCRPTLHSLISPRISQRSFSTKPPKRADFNIKNRHSNDSLHRYPRNNEISAQAIYLVLPDGSLGPLRSTAEVLSSLDLNTQILTVVQPGTSTSPPVGKIVDKLASRTTEKAPQKSKKAGKTGKAGKAGTTSKTLELNWGIDKNDLAHRLNKVREFLRKGFKVEIICAPKRRAKKLANLEEAESLVRRIREAIDEVEGAKESKAMEGKLLQQATLFAEGKPAEGALSGKPQA